MNKNHDQEKEKFNSIVAEVMHLKNKLASDINAVDALRNELLSQQEEAERNKNRDESEKIEIVLKYDKKDNNDSAIKKDGLGKTISNQNSKIGDQIHKDFKSISNQNSNLLNSKLSVVNKGEAQKDEGIKTISNNNSNPQFMNSKLSGGIKPNVSAIHSNKDLKKSDDTISLRRNTDKDNI